jgi:hypothetical protein
MHSSKGLSMEKSVKRELALAQDRVFSVPGLGRSLSSHPKTVVDFSIEKDKITASNVCTVLEFLNNL